MQPDNISQVYITMKYEKDTSSTFTILLVVNNRMNKKKSIKIFNIPSTNIRQFSFIKLELLRNNLKIYCKISTRSDNSPLMIFLWCKHKRLNYKFHHYAFIVWFYKFIKFIKFIKYTMFIYCKFTRYIHIYLLQKYSFDN